MMNFPFFCAVIRIYWNDQNSKTLIFFRYSADKVYSCDQIIAISLPLTLLFLKNYRYT